ncbi:MAG TPA: ubiquinol-cytochrome c reductase iron-sulfur subunit [Candidatus Binataceae bacterium]|nr:ubiquinol-cytochrome c reductase iron-sulfur subunit [Candidatus Binataceae bacterium]
MAINSPSYPVIDTAGPHIETVGEVGAEENRRSFITRLFWGAIGLVSAGIAAPIVSYLISPIFGEHGAADWVQLGKLDDLPINVPQRVEVVRRVVEGWVTASQQVTAWVVRLPDKLYVFDPHCTHLGCAYRWDDQAKSFFCPCHSAVFNLEGKVVSGPPPRPLDVYNYEIRDGFVYVVPNPVERVA